MNKPIEVGCLVMVYGLVRDVGDNGKCGVVVKWAEKDEELVRVPLEGGGYGRLIANGKPGWVVESEGFDYGMAVFHERNLLRIDDYTEETETQEEEMTV